MYSASILILELCLVLMLSATLRHTDIETHLTLHINDAALTFNFTRI